MDGMDRIIVRDSYNLESLNHQLREIFSADEINVEKVQKVMARYDSNESDWKKFAKFERYKYTRNLVDEGNGKYNLMILCWGEGQASSIHDHSDAHCFMKVLKGTLRETLYEWPQENNETGFNQMVARGSATLKLNDVCYINDTIGLHRVDNPSHVEQAVSLHLYCPPFNACRTFDERTGKQLVCPVTFWSKYGIKVDHLKPKDKPKDKKQEVA